MSIGFDRSRDRRQRELTNNKTQIGKFHVRIYLRNVFALAEYQDKATFGLGYKLTLTGYTDNALLKKGNAINNAKFKINANEWYVPQYAPSVEQQKVLMNQIIKRTATELQNPEKSVFLREVNTQNSWIFELGTQEGINIHLWIFTVFRQNDREQDQNMNNDTFCRLPVTSAQCNFGTERYPDSAILLI